MDRISLAQLSPLFFRRQNANGPSERENELLWSFGEKWIGRSSQDKKNFEEMVRDEKKTKGRQKQLVRIVLKQKSVTSLIHFLPLYKRRNPGKHVKRRSWRLLWHTQCFVDLNGTLVLCSPWCSSLGSWDHSNHTQWRPTLASPANENQSRFPVLNVEVKVFGRQSKTRANALIPKLQTLSGVDPIWWHWSQQSHSYCIPIYQVSGHSFTWRQGWPQLSRFGFGFCLLRFCRNSLLLHLFWLLSSAPKTALC